MLERRRRPINLTPVESAWLDEQLAESALRVEAVRKGAEEMIANSRKSIQPRLRRIVDDCQADYDTERESGWAAD